MKRYALLLLPLVACNIASAGVLTCNGSYWWVKFAARATTSDRAITSDVTVKVTGAPGGNKVWNLKPSASQIAPGQAVSFTASAPEGSGVLNAQYNGQYYVGTIRATTSYGNYDVPVKCSLANR